MKIKIGEKVYLQKYEVIQLSQRPAIVAECVRNELIDSYGIIYSVPQDLDVYKFEYVFTNPDSVKWLMEQDYIVDYDELVDLPEAELMKRYKEASDQYDKIISNYHNYNSDYQRDHHEETMNDIYRAKWKYSSIAEFIALTKGRISQFGFPKEYTGKRVEFLFTQEEPAKKRPKIFECLTKLFSA